MVDPDAIPRRLLDESAPRRGPPAIRDNSSDLSRPAPGLPPRGQRFYVAHSARRLANGPGDLLGDLHVGRGKVYIEGNERVASADHGCTRGPEPRRPIVGLSGLIGQDLVAQTLELPATRFSRFARSGLVAAYSYRYTGICRVSPTRLPNVRERDAFLHAGAGQWHKRHHIGSANTRMLAFVLI